MKIINGTLVLVENNVTSAIIPDNVIHIDDWAFAGCTGLKSVIIPNSVTSIGKYTFSRCEGLTSITIPDSVTSIGENAFQHCTGLRSVTISNGVTNIDQQVFCGCTGLTNVTISDSVTSIGVSAFGSCTGLTSITIPNSVKSIGSSAFRGCTGLANIAIPESVTSIGRGAFYGCTALTTRQNNYKAFALKHQQLFCRTKYFYTGKRGWAKGSLKLCENGIHFCTNLYDIFNYYSGSYEKHFVIALCDVSDEQDATGSEDTKRCARWVRPTHVLTHEELIALLNNPMKGGEK